MPSCGLSLPAHKRTCGRALGPDGFFTLSRGSGANLTPMWARYSLSHHEEPSDRYLQEVYPCLGKDRRFAILRHWRV